MSQSLVNAALVASALSGGFAVAQAAETTPSQSEPPAITEVVPKAQSVEEDRQPVHAARLLGQSVTVGAGALGASYTFNQGRWGDFFATQQVDARWRFGGFTVEGGLMHALPIDTEGASQSFTGHLRAGWTTRRFTGTVGATAQYATVAQPQMQYWPSVRASYAFDRFGLTAGLFDLHALALARLSVELGEFGVGYVAPLGAEAHVRFRVTESFLIGVQAMAFQVANAQYGFLAVSGVWDADSMSAGGAK